MQTAWLAALVVALVVGVLVWLRTDTAERWYYRTESARKIGSIVVGVLIAVVFLSSGDPIRSLIGILLVAIGSLYLFIEAPWRRI